MWYGVSHQNGKQRNKKNRKKDFKIFQKYLLINTAADESFTV